MKWTAIGLWAALVCGAVSVNAGASVYTFEGLNLATLPGQDNWVQSNGGPPDVVTPTGAGNASTRAAMGQGASNNEDLASRLNDGNFSIPAIANNLTALVIQADFRVSTSGANQGTFGVGRDVNNDGVIQTSLVAGQYEVGPVIGAYYISSPRFFVAINGAGTFAGDAAAPAGVSAGDWVRTQLVIDLTANGGDGSGSVFVQNLTTNQVGFTPVAGLQNLSLGLNSGGQVPSAWNGMYIEMYGGAVNSTQIDNLTVLVPEPASLALLGFGTLLVTSRLRKN